MKSLYDQIDALRAPALSDQMVDAGLTLFILIALFAVITLISRLFVAVIEWRQRRGVVGKVVR